MPELPEVEIICQALNNKITGHIIEKVELKRSNLRYPFPNKFCEQLAGKKILLVKRRAKYILIFLEMELVLIIHLGMTGKLTIQKENSAKLHDHVVFTLDSYIVIYNDVRRFGSMRLCKKNEIDNYFSNLGIEPLSDEFNAEYFHQKLKINKSPIKTILMNNQILVGVGNIYACEVLFYSSISPLTPGNRLSLTEIVAIVNNIKIILQKAIEAGGSSFSDYRHINGQKGSYQQKFKVYGRAGKECYLCKNIIITIKQSGRSSFYCPNCQKSIE